MKEFTMKIVGTRPLLMHNSRLANPLDPITRQMKELTGKRKKTDDDHANISHLEFLGSLYHDKTLGPFIPDANVFACLINGGKFLRLGEKVKQGIAVLQAVNPLLYQGPRDPEGLWADEAFRHFAIVTVQAKRLGRTRPQFQNWELDVPCAFDEELFSWSAVEQIVSNASRYVGLGDWRPRFGIFDVTLEQH